MKRFLFIILLIVSGCTAINKANKFYKEGDYSAAINECHTIIAHDSLNAEAHFMLGKCYRAQVEFEQAIQSLSTAYYITPKTYITQKAKSELIATRLQFGDTLHSQQKISSALEEYKYVLKLNSTNTPCMMKLGDLYYENGYFDKARDMYQTMLKFDDENKPAKDKIEQIDKRAALAEADYQLGEQNFKKYHYKTAVKFLKKALKNKPDHKDAQYYLALAQGSILYNQGRKSNLWEAIEEFGKAMSLRPESGEPHYYLALAYEKKDRRDFDNAIREYKLALEKNPDREFATACKKKIKELIKLRDRLKKFWGK